MKQFNLGTAALAGVFPADKVARSLLIPDLETVPMPSAEGGITTVIAVAERPVSIIEHLLGPLPNSELANVNNATIERSEFSHSVSRSEGP